MKSRFRLAAATAALALVAAFAAGCATHGSRTATSDATAPVNDADWHSLVKSGRGCYQRNDFKAALPLFVSAANRSRALDDPNGLAVALLDQARCLEEMDVAAVLSAFDRAAATGEPAALEASYLTEQTRLVGEIRAARTDSRLAPPLAASLDVALAEAIARCGSFRVAWPGWEAWDAMGEVNHILRDMTPDVLSPADRERLRFANAALLSGRSPCDFLQQPPEEGLPPALRARYWLVLAHECNAGRLDSIETAAAIYREAGRPDGVALALSLVSREPAQGGLPEDPARAASLALRGASACHALGYVHLAASLLDSAEAVDNPAIRERSALLRASLCIPSVPTPAEPKGESQP